MESEKKKKTQLGKCSSGDFIDESVVTDHMGEKSEPKVKKCEAMKYRCGGMASGQVERWLIIKRSLPDR